MAANSEQQPIAVGNAEFQTAVVDLEFDIMRAIDGQPGSVAIIALTHAAAHVIGNCFPGDKWIRKIEQMSALISLRLAHSLKQGGTPS